MPNWCDNMVTLRHEDKAVVDALDTELSKKNDDGHSMAEMFNHLRPQPKEFDEGDGWYNWNCSNWGTKWDASIIDWERQDDNTIWVSMNTAWSPPTALYDFLTEEGWSVRAVYYEPGMGYGGVYEDGDDDYYEFDWTSREEIENLPGDLIEFGDLLTQYDEYEKERIYEEWGDAERTQWYDVSVKPKYFGYYEVTTKGWDFPQLVKFENDEWEYYNNGDLVKWRGLAQDPNWDPVVELDKILNETKVD